MQYAVQLYLFRKIIKKPADMLKVFARLADMGYGGIEPFMPLGVSADKAAAAAGNARIINPHVAISDILRSPDKVFGWARDAGAKTVCFSRLVPFYRVFGINKVLQTISASEEYALKYGVELCYHNHRAELYTANGTTAMQQILVKTQVKWELDAFWAEKAGANVGELFEKYADRILYLHLKDSTARGKFCPIGSGVVACGKQIEIAEGAGCGWAVADLDNSTVSPYETAELSLRFFNGVGEGAPRA